MSLSLSTAEPSFNLSNFFFLFPPKLLENLLYTTFFKPHSLKLWIWLSPPLHLTVKLQSPQHQSQLHIWSFQTYLCKLLPLWIHLSPCLQLFCTIHCSLIISQTIFLTSVLKKIAVSPGSASPQLHYLYSVFSLGTWFTSPASSTPLHRAKCVSLWPRPLSQVPLDFSLVYTSGFLRLTFLFLLKKQLLGSLGGSVG